MGAEGRVEGRRGEERDQRETLLCVGSGSRGKILVIRGGLLHRSMIEEGY